LTIRPKEIPQEMLGGCGTLYRLSLFLGDWKKNSKGHKMGHKKMFFVGGWSRRCSAKRFFAHHMASSGQ